MSLAMRPNEVNTKVQYDCKVRHQAVIFLYAEVLNMRKNLTEIVFILDRSGSMSGLEADTMVPSRFMRKIICRLRLNEVSRQ